MLSSCPRLAALAAAIALVISSGSPAAGQQAAKDAVDAEKRLVLDVQTSRPVIDRQDATGAHVVGRDAKFDRAR